MSQTTQNVPIPQPRGHWPCICGSGQIYRACCRRWHGGDSPPTPESLMRARFSAYAWGKIGFIMDTTHPACPDYQADRDAWWSRLAQSILSRRYDSLVVLAASAEGDQGQVTFAASGLEAGARVVHREQSQFVREDGRWLYCSGILQESLTAGPMPPRSPPS